MYKRQVKTNSNELESSEVGRGPGKCKLDIGHRPKNSTLDAAVSTDTDAAIAAADLLKKLEHGYYVDLGKRRKINGDFSKLIFAEQVSDLQKRLLSDFRFRCSVLPGTRDPHKNWSSKLLGHRCIREWYIYDGLTQ